MKRSEAIDLLAEAVQEGDRDEQDTAVMDLGVAVKLKEMLGDGIKDNSPFDVRLAHTPYLVLPKLAIISMPLEWQKRLEQLLLEMEAAGIDSTPDYYCFLQDNGHQIGAMRNMAIERGKYDPADAYYVFVNRMLEDPWSDYRHGDIKKLCPEFNPNKEKEE